MDNNTPQSFSIQREHRTKLNGHNSFVVWFTGLSGSGKSTLANKLEKKLFDRGVHTFSLDGDNIRNGLNTGLGFGREDRVENLRRSAEVAKLLVNSGTLVIASFISPLEEDRKNVKAIIGENDYVEIFVDTSLKICEERDVKGLYKKARSGEIKNFTGIDAPYEKPLTPDIIVKTDEEGLIGAVDRICEILEDKLGLNNE